MVSLLIEPSAHLPMSTKHEEISHQAMSLDPAERASLAHQLIRSLDPTVEDPENVQHAWAAEIERRVELIRSGEATLIPAEDVLSEARRRLG